MDIDLLSKMIKELVMDHDRVSLPGLGTFVAETVPAAFSDKGYTVNPPYRKLSFRPVKDKESDTLLVDFYASANGVSSEIAERALVTFIDGLRDVLQTRKNVVFPGLGRMRATKENNFFFVADEDLDIYPEGFGLVSLSLKTHEETKEEVSAAVDALKSLIEEVPSGEDEQLSDQMPDEEMVSDDKVSDSHDTDVCENIFSGEAVSPRLEDPETEEKVMAQIEEPLQEENAVPEVDAIPDVNAVPGIHPEMESSSVSSSGRWRKGLFIAAIVLLALAFLMLLYVVVARLFPDFIDNILYNTEEYNILHRS